MSKAANVPMGWSNYRSYHHYKSVFPVSSSSMHLNIHKNIPDRIRPRRGLSAPDSNLRSAENVIKILDKQRPLAKSFIGVKTLTTKDLDELSTRLASYNPSRMPAEAKGCLPPIHQYDICQRGMRVFSTEEYRRTIDGLARALREREAEEARKKNGEENKDEAGDSNKMTAAEISKLIDRLAQYDPEKHPAMSKGKPPRDEDLSYILKRTKSASDVQIKEMVERLVQFNPERWPPSSPMKETEASREKSGTKKKKANKAEVDKMVGRLAKFDTKKWPPESAGMKSEYYQGKQQKFNNSD